MTANITTPVTKTCVVKVSQDTFLLFKQKFKGVCEYRNFIFELDEENFTIFYPHPLSGNLVRLGILTLNNENGEFSGFVNMKMDQDLKLIFKVKGKDKKLPIVFLKFKRNYLSPVFFALVNSLYDSSSTIFHPVEVGNYRQLKLISSNSTTLRHFKKFSYKLGKIFITMDFLYHGIQPIDNMMTEIDGTFIFRNYIFESSEDEEKIELYSSDKKIIATIDIIKKVLSIKPTTGSLSADVKDTAQSFIQIMSNLINKKFQTRIRKYYEDEIIVYRCSSYMKELLRKGEYKSSGVPFKFDRRALSSK